MCEYCESKKPLTDKIYDDGTKFDDWLSTRIEYFGETPIIVSEYKKKNFDFPFCMFLTEDQKVCLSQTWGGIH